VRTGRFRPSGKDHAYDALVSGRVAIFSLAIALALVLLAAAVLVARQESLVFFPDRHLSTDPSQYGLSARILSLRTDDGTDLHGWWIQGTGRCALLYFHGNAGNIGDRLDRVKGLVDELGLDVFLVDYRGYGKSGGKPTEAGVYSDGLAIYEAAATRGFESGRIVLFGESLGGAVAVETALHKGSAGLILEAPFLSMAAMAKRYYPWVPRFLLRLSFDNGAKISKVSAPKLIAQSQRDEIVPPEQTRRLFELASPPKTYYVIAGAGHNDTTLAGGRPYLEAWKRFLDETVPPAR
jgi:fermentation-respiration switch protein FrsA (DUF1100 family)